MNVWKRVRKGLRYSFLSDVARTSVAERELLAETCRGRWDLPALRGQG